MKRFLSTLLILTTLLSAQGAGAAGINWSGDVLSAGEYVMTATGVEKGDRVAVEVFSDGVFSRMETIWAAGDTLTVPVTISEGENSARAFIWEQGTLCPKHPGSYITDSGVMDESAIFSDDQYVNHSATIGYRTIEPIVGDYSITFNLTVLTKGNNAIMLGDSANGDLQYSTNSAILQFNGDNFITWRGDGTGSYVGDSVTLCPVTTGTVYTVTMQGNTETNSFKIIMSDGVNKYASPVMRSRKNATAAGIDTIAFVSNSHKTTVKNGYCSGYYFCGTNLTVSTESIDRTPLYTYSGFEGLYYGMQLVETGNYIRGNNGALTADYTAASDTSAMFIPRSMGDGSHAFECVSSSNRLTQSGTSVVSSAYKSADNTQHWVLEQSESYAEDNLTYYIKSLDGGEYIGESGGSLSLTDSANKKEIRFVPIEAEKQSPLYRVSQTYVYNLLSDAQRERLESVYESVAGDAFPRYGKTGEYTPRIRMDNMFNEILGGSLTEAQQLAKIEEFLNTTNGYIFPGQADTLAVSSSLPGTENLTWDIDEGVAGNYDFWSGDKRDGMLYKYTIYNADGTTQQTINLYVHDAWPAPNNAATFKEAVVGIPYVFRKYLNTVKIRNDQANSFNGGGTTLYIRLNYVHSDANAMRSTIIHELGHIVDSQYSGWWSSGSEWKAAIASDMYSVSEYANTSTAEDFAEFARLYFESYGNPDMQRGLKVLMPGRYASFGKVRQEKLGGWGLWEDEYTTAN